MCRKAKQEDTIVKMVENVSNLFKTVSDWLSLNPGIAISFKFLQTQTTKEWGFFHFCWNADLVFHSNLFVRISCQSLFSENKIDITHFSSAYFRPWQKSKCWRFIQHYHLTFWGKMSADEIWKYSFFLFFPGKIRKNTISLSSAEFVQREIKV